MNGQKQHALLESPTGTGKSLALLCGVMAWLESQKKQGRIPRYDDPEVSIHDEKELGSKRRLLEQDSSSQRPAKLEQSSQQSPPSQPPASLVPKIYIASRTHRQLAQLVKELRRTGYSPRFTVLGSRNQYCIHDSVKGEADINEACKKVLRPEKPEDRCPFANKVKKIASENEPYSTNMDVEELVRFGVKKKGKLDTVMTCYFP